MVHQCEYCNKLFKTDKSGSGSISMSSYMPDCDCYEELPIYRGRLEVFEEMYKKYTQMQLDLSIAQDEVRRLNAALASVT